MFSYPCPLDKNGNPICPGDLVIAETNGESIEVRVVGISSPVSALVMASTSDGQTVIQEVASKFLVMHELTIGDVIRDAYELGKTSKKKRKDLDWEYLVETYKRELAKEVETATMRQELSNKEMLKVLVETQQEIEEIKRGLE